MRGKREEFWVLMFILILIGGFISGNVRFVSVNQTEFGVKVEIGKTEGVDLTQEEQLIEEEAMANEQQLLLDQPDTINHQGKIERVVSEPGQKSLNDNTEVDQKPEVLLTEDPLDGVEIILG